MLAGETHDAKQLDYGSDDDPFANVRQSEALGIPGWVGAVLRNNDKQVRLAKAARDTIQTGEPNLANEGVLDSLLDQAVYALIGYVLFEEWLAVRELAYHDMIADGWEPTASELGWLDGEAADLLTYDQFDRPNDIGFEFGPVDSPEFDGGVVIDMGEWLSRMLGEQQQEQEDRSLRVTVGDLVKIQNGVKAGEYAFVAGEYEGGVYLSIGGIPMSYSLSEVELVG